MVETTGWLRPDYYDNKVIKTTKYNPTCKIS